MYSHGVKLLDHLIGQLSQKAILMNRNTQELMSKIFFKCKASYLSLCEINLVVNYWKTET